METDQHEQARLPKIIALPVFASDAISSTAYATQQILLALGAAGLWASQYRELYTNLTMGITLAIVLLLAIVVTSYWQTIFAYPSGGGSYIVSKDNLGTNPSLVAGAALLIDYVLTVAVSIAAGVQNLLATPLAAHFQLRDNAVAVSLFFIAVLTLANLRGAKESGTVFAVFTYTFVFTALLMVILGAFSSYLGWEVHADLVNRHIPDHAAKMWTPVGSFALVALALKAFANGCAAMTGTEAVADGVPAFRKPQAKNAALTLVMMAMILGTLFIGISWNATKLHVVYWETGGKHAMPVIDQLSGAIFGKESSGIRLLLYYLMQGSTGAILLLAANTAFADFPRLSYFMSRDRFLPRQLANLGDRLVYSNGIALLGLLAMLLILATKSSVGRLIPLYAIGVFTAFTLSQSAMVARWFRTKVPRWQLKLLINGFGALCTGIVLVTIAAEKFREGAWFVIVFGALLVLSFRKINNHYEDLRRRLSILNWRPERRSLKNTTLLLVPSLHKGIFPALDYAVSISDDCRAVHVEIDSNDTARLMREWEEYVTDDVPLVVLPSLYRSLIAPLLVYLDEVRKERPDHIITVVVPEFVSEKWWHTLLHNKNSLLLRYYLLSRPGVIYTNVRYFLSEAQPEISHISELGKKR